MADINADDAEDQTALIDQLTPEEASRIIHSHRKVRYGKKPPLSQSDVVSSVNELIRPDRYGMLALSSTQGEM